MPSNVIPDTHRDLLEKPILAYVATIGPSGEPQNNPVWFLWSEEKLLIAIDPNGQKARNLQRDPRIALSMADPDDPIHYLEIRGTAVFDRTVNSKDPILISLVRKYTGEDSYAGMPDEHSFFLIDPLRTTTLG